MWHRRVAPILCALALLPPSQALIGDEPPAASVQFSNRTKAAHIEFAHYKGSNGTSTILEEAGPGFCRNRSNRDGMGTRIRVHADNQWQVREIASAGSYLSQSDLRTNFGLKAATRVELVEVTWPSGLRQAFENLEADKFYVVEEGQDRVTAASVHAKTN
jgi:hypothetical protein